MSPRRIKRRLLIDIRLPNEQGSRVTVRAEEPDVSAKALDEWQKVAEECLKLIAAHFRRTNI